MDQENFSAAENPHVKKLQRELNAGTVALVMLTIIERAGQPLYGYQIAKTLEHADESVVAGKQSALYPVLRTMCANGLLDSYVEPSVSGPPRRYYRITEQGRAVLVEWQQALQKTKNFVDQILSEADHA